jgi:hypothetical protein
MEKEMLIAELRKQQKINDKEMAHEEADQLLLDYINDDEIRAEYNLIDKWYA